MTLNPIRTLLLTLVGAVGVAAQAGGPEREIMVSAGALAIQNVTLIPMTGAASLPSITVLVRDGRIVAVGPSSDVAIPAGVPLVDGTGKFLIPGLIEMHSHLSKTRLSSMALFAASGVTTVRDMGGDYEELLRWKRRVATGDTLGPTIVMAGPILESQSNVDRMRKDSPADRAEPFERVRVGVATPADAKTTVARLAALEIDFLKIRTVQDRETYLALNQAASAHGPRWTGENRQFVDTAKAAISKAAETG